MRWERIDNVRREMVERGMSSLIVSDPMSIYYLSDVYIEPGERMLALLIKPDAVKLYVNALFPVEQQDGLEICVLNDGFEPTIQLSQDVSGIVGVDKNWPSRFLLALMEHASIKPVVGSPAVDICRMHKDAWEMEEMRKASAGNDRVMERTIRQLREGMTERELAAIMTKIYDEEGMPRVAFDPLICFGENGAFPHHETGDSKLKPGDSVIIDTGHRWGMYCSDMTRTVFFKSCTDEQRNVYDIVNKANRAGESIARPGIALRDVDAAARNVIIAAGYGEFFTHRTGHGIGIDVHEPPDVAATNSQLAEVGMVFSVEPGIYLPGKFGVRIEDLVAMTENGCEVLNHHTHDLIIVD
ncbi:MAG: aminopeptidase P family protein [Clostridiales bacterium]|nr:aminopeptidase P family protein [Clostridiales bacterium]